MFVLIRRKYGYSHHLLVILLSTSEVVMSAAYGQLRIYSLGFVALRMLQPAQQQQTPS